jgi:hypothetical protein
MVLRLVVVNHLDFILRRSLHKTTFDFYFRPRRYLAGPRSDKFPFSTI